MPAQEAATSSRPGVWGALRTVVPRWAQAKPPSGKAERSSVAVAATAGGAVLDPPAAGLERTSFNLATQEQQKQSDAAPTDPSCPDFGYARGLDKKFRVLRELGRGGNGVVRRRTSRALCALPPACLQLPLCFCFCGSTVCTHSHTPPDLRAALTQPLHLTTAQTAGAGGGGAGDGRRVCAQVHPQAAHRPQAVRGVSARGWRRPRGAAGAAGVAGRLEAGG